MKTLKQLPLAATLSHNQQTLVRKASHLKIKSNSIHKLSQSEKTTKNFTKPTSEESPPSKKRFQNCQTRWVRKEEIGAGGSKKEMGRRWIEEGVISAEGKKKRKRKRASLWLWLWGCGLWSLGGVAAGLLRLVPFLSFRWWGLSPKAPDLLAGLVVPRTQVVNRKSVTETIEKRRPDKLEIDIEEIHARKSRSGSNTYWKHLPRHPKWPTRRMDRRNEKEMKDEDLRTDEKQLA